MTKRMRQWYEDYNAMATAGDIHPQGERITPRKEINRELERKVKINEGTDDERWIYDSQRRAIPLQGDTHDSAATRVLRRHSEELQTSLYFDLEDLEDSSEEDERFSFLGEDNKINLDFSNPGEVADAIQQIKTKEFQRKRRVDGNNYAKLDDRSALVDKLLVVVTLEEKIREDEAFKRGAGDVPAARVAPEVEYSRIVILPEEHIGVPRENVNLRYKTIYLKKQDSKIYAHWYEPKEGGPGERYENETGHKKLIDVIELPEGFPGFPEGKDTRNAAVKDKDNDEDEDYHELIDGIKALCEVAPSAPSRKLVSNLRSNMQNVKNDLNNELGDRGVSIGNVPIDSTTRYVESLYRAGEEVDAEFNRKKDNLLGKIDGRNRNAEIYLGGEGPNKRTKGLWHYKNVFLKTKIDTKLRNIASKITERSTTTASGLNTERQEALAYLCLEKLYRARISEGTHKLSRLKRELESAPATEHAEITEKIKRVSGEIDRQKNNLLKLEEEGTGKESWNGFTIRPKNKTSLNTEETRKWAEKELEKLTKEVEEIASLELLQDDADDTIAELEKISKELKPLGNSVQIDASGNEIITTGKVDNLRNPAQLVDLEAEAQPNINKMQGLEDQVHRAAVDLGVVQSVQSYRAQFGLRNKRISRKVNLNSEQLSELKLHLLPEMSVEKFGLTEDQVKKDDALAKFIKAVNALNPLLEQLEEMRQLNDTCPGAFASPETQRKYQKVLRDLKTQMLEVRELHKSVDPRILSRYMSEHPNEIGEITGCLDIIDRQMLKDLPPARFQIKANPDAIKDDEILLLSSWTYHLVKPGWMSQNSMGESSNHFFLPSRVRVEQEGAGMSLFDLRSALAEFKGKRDVRNVFAKAGWSLDDLKIEDWKDMSGVRKWILGIPANGSGLSITGFPTEDLLEKWISHQAQYHQKHPKPDVERDDTSNAVANIRFS